ncbi:hypothetical protein O9K51_04164 [Purpureocillium lavendulum]|uniref:Uncharacterized protein n=1 Tax=Purpureocillium lavendulum TaxID=1247861 RepID=A0AB34FVL0_9HYPO|nr:hypothetical protein O9K51_04164 [Purpureocillium lavendulum]
MTLIQEEFCHGTKEFCRNVDTQTNNHVTKEARRSTRQVHADFEIKDSLEGFSNKVNRHARHSFKHRTAGRREAQARDDRVK